MDRETPVHGKASLVFHEGKGIFEGVSDPFEAGRYHSLVVLRKTLPDELELTAWTEDGLVMAAQHRTLPRYGVQFHPESILTPEGPGSSRTSSVFPRADVRELRHPAGDDYDRVIVQLDDWWNGREMTVRLPRLWFDHFADTSFVVEDDGDTASLSDSCRTSAPTRPTSISLAWTRSIEARAWRVSSTNGSSRSSQRERRTGCVTSPANDGLDRLPPSDASNSSRAMRS